MSTQLNSETYISSDETSASSAEGPARKAFGTFAIHLRVVYAVLAFAAFASVARCQQAPGTEPAQPDAGANTVAPETSQLQSRHILGLIPNYRSFPTLQNYKPLSIREKFKIASEDSLDRGTFVMAAAFGGLGQLTNSNSRFMHRH